MAPPQAERINVPDLSSISEISKRFLKAVHKSDRPPFFRRFLNEKRCPIYQRPFLIGGTGSGKAGPAWEEELHMETQANLRTLATSILDSYAMRVETVKTLMEQAHGFLKGYQNELSDMIDRLRENLARGGSLRKADFDRMIRDILDPRTEQARETEESLLRFQGEEEEMIRRLRAILLQGGDDGLKNIQEIRFDILRRQKEREREILYTLKQFQLAQEEVRACLKDLLAKGEHIRIKDLRGVLRVLKAQQTRRDSDLLNTIEELGTVRERVHSQWQQVLGV